MHPDDIARRIVSRLKPSDNLNWDAACTRLPNESDDAYTARVVELCGQSGGAISYILVCGTNEEGQQVLLDILPRYLR